MLELKTAKWDEIDDEEDSNEPEKEDEEDGDF